MDDAPEPRWNDVLPSTYWEAVADPWVEGVATFLWHGPQAVAEGNRHARSVPDWPAHLVAIGDDGAGTWLVLDVGRPNSPVLAWRPEFGRRAECHARSVEDYVLTCVRELLDDADPCVSNLPATVRRRAAAHQPADDNELHELATKINDEHHAWSEEKRWTDRAGLHLVVAGTVAALSGAGLVACWVMQATVHWYALASGGLVAAIASVLEAWPRASDE
ncbi:MAG: hypothetical protein KDA25_01360 [Phycisphaerales bacterium]|nr:hypothetical protein [Phycisphaerales bacterium]